MVLTITLQRPLSVSVEVLAQLLFADASFEQRFHSSLQHRDIQVTDWMQLPDAVKQRICFFTMIDESAGDSGFKSTRCIETQKYSVDPSGALKIESSIVPENSISSNLFAVRSEWVATSTGVGISDLSMMIHVESKVKSIFDSMIEKKLGEKIRELYEEWLKQAQSAVDMHILKQAEQKKASPILKKNSKRKIAAVRSRVVAGTENIVQLLQSNESKEKLLRTFHSETSKDKGSDDEDEIINIGASESSLTVPTEIARATRKWTISYCRSMFWGSYWALGAIVASLIVLGVLILYWSG